MLACSCLRSLKSVTPSSNDVVTILTNSLPHGKSNYMGMDGHYFRELRRSLGLTQEQVARQSGVSRERVSQIEQSPDMPVEADTLFALAETVKTSPIRLMRRDVPTETVNLEEILDPELVLFFSETFNKLRKADQDWIKDSIRHCRDRYEREHRMEEGEGRA